MMMRLTPDKVRGYGQALPCNARRINKGNTSIIYTTDDPNKLEVFTIEPIKLEWWQNLEIIDSFTEVAEAVYHGYTPRYDGGGGYKTIKLPVYRCLVDRLEMPSTTDHRKQIRAIRNAVETARPAYVYNQRENVRLYNWWSNIADCGVPAAAYPARFALNWDAEHIYPDVGRGDFAILHGDLVILDPFHHQDIHPALSMTKNPPYSRFY